MSPELLVLTQNLWGGAPGWPRRRDRLARRIERLGPDVVGFQEVHAGGAWKDRDQALELAEAVGGYEVSYAPGREAPGGRSEGLALLTRRPPIARSTLYLSQDTSDRIDRPFRRVVLSATIDGPAGPIDLFVTHLSLSRRARDRTVPELLRFAEGVRRRSGSVAAVLLGDLNAVPSEPCIAAIRAGLGPRSCWLDAWEVSGRSSSGATWPVPCPWRRIDYVLAQLPPGARIDSCEREPFAGSDHLGVAARLSFGPGASP